jgi:hypothetical protein
MKRPAPNNTARFLNVDLEVESRSDLDLLTAAMGKRVVVLYSGPVSKSKRHLLAVECARHFAGPNEAIRALCAIIENLPPEARRVWDGARKEFDIGCEWEPSNALSRFTIRPETVRRMANLGASLAISHYRES